MLEVARAAGVSVIDTAASYGTSESVIGELVGDDPEWSVVTKVSGSLGDEVDASPAIAAQLAQGALDSLDRSLLRLRRPRIAVLLLHRASHRRAAGGRIWRALREQRELGRIGALGISAADPSEAMEAIDDPEVEAIQVAASLADQRLLRAGFFEKARDRRMSVFIRSSLLQGALLLPPERLPLHLKALTPLLAALTAQARALAVDPKCLLLAHVRHRRTAVVVGCETEAQLVANLDAWGVAGELPDPGSGFSDLAASLDRSILEPGRWPSPA